MLLVRLFVLILAVIVMAITGLARQTPAQGRPWPPAVEKAPSDAPVLQPAEALRTFSMPPGFRLELAASEPTIQDPIAIEWDAAGRMWALELPGYMRDINAPGELDPVGRIVVLEDVDRDGVFEKRTVFADELVQPRALRLLDGGVLVGEPPDIWLMQDTDGDMRADRKDLVASGYGRQDTNVEVNANGLLWALDNAIYMAGTGADMYLRFSKGRFEARPSISRGQWGVTQDDRGRVYRNHNESALHVDLVPTPYFARHPGLLRTRGSHEALSDPGGDVNAVWPARQTPGTNRAYQHGILREDGTLAAFTAACAPTVYRGDRLPSELHGNVFVAEPTANLISRLVLADDGSMLRARKAYERAEFLTSTDERFRPVNLSSGPDGTLYVVDMYRGIIQHRAYITEYLRDQILARKLEQPIGHGRIYRVVHETSTLDRETSGTLPAGATRGANLGFEGVPSDRLVKLLAHANGWWRDSAQQALVQRGDVSVVPALATAARTADDWRTRLHALWTLDGLDAADAALVTAALEDPSSDVRIAAVRIAERWLPEPDQPMTKLVLARMADPDRAVRRQLAASLGALPSGPRATALATLLERHADDPVVVDAAISGLRGSEAAVLEALLAGEESTARDTAITVLAATLVKSGQEQPVERVLAWAADATRARWQRSALLHGLEAAVLGAPLPGTSAPRTARASGPAAPCATCPGGRAGPGGAYAFPRGRGTAGGRAGGRGRGNEPAWRLTREPVTLSAWAARNDEFRPRLDDLLARSSWPGKPGDAAPIPTLTAEAQQRFDAGRVVYQNICQACHQADGRGQDRLAPPLIGSPLTLGPDGIPIRILLHGKEGTVGLMPPVGGTLSDDQIASVLTYVRREWGQSGSPIEPATVRAVREESGGRTRPWTDGELMKMTEGAGK
jgi:putative membrane-bound dehydrogenase-like protein